MPPASARACHARAGVAGHADLVKLLFAADVLVTVESLSAVEALVLDRPVVVLNMPTNLAEMVEAAPPWGSLRAMTLGRRSARCSTIRSRASGWQPRADATSGTSPRCRRSGRGAHPRAVPGGSRGRLAPAARGVISRSFRVSGEAWYLLRSMRPTVFPLGTRQIGEGQPCFVLAEVASAHGGSCDRALRMIESAFKMGADGIKFQMFRADLLVVHRHPSRKDFDAIELTEKEWRKLLAAARSSGLTLLVEAFDRPSLELAPSTTWTPTRSTRPTWRTRVHPGGGSRGQACALRHRGVPEDAVREALDLVGSSPVALLHGYQTFPHPSRRSAFASCRHGRSATTSPSASWTTPTAARLRPRGACARRRVGRRPGGEALHARPQREGYDYQSSLSPEDFYRMWSCCARPSAPRATRLRGAATGRSAITA